MVLRVDDFIRTPTTLVWTARTASSGTVNSAVNSTVNSTVNMTRKKKKKEQQYLRRQLILYTAVSDAEEQELGIAGMHAALEQVTS